MGTKPLAKKILVALSLCTLGLAGSAQAATNQAGDEVSFTEEEWEANVHWRHKTSGYGISFAVEEGAVTEVSVKAADGTLIVDSNGVKVNTGGIESEASTSLVTGQTVYNYLHQESVAIGKGSYVEVDPGIAIGRDAVTRVENGVAIGYEAVAGDSRTDAEKAADATTRIQTVSFGHKKGEYAGYYKNAVGEIVDEETAKKYNELNTDEHAQYKAVNYESDSFARLTNVADGIDNHDAATVGQLNSVINNAKTTIAADTAKLISYDKDTSTIKIGAGDGITAESVSVGDRKITGVAAGKAATDAVNVSQMNSAISAATSTLSSTVENLNTTIGEKLAEDGNVILKDNSVTANISALDTKIGKVSEGTYQAISASNTISENLIALDKALGEGSSGTDVSNLKTITRADSAEATGTDAIALGSDAKAAGENAIAFGTGSVVTGTDSIAVGTGHQISGNNSGAFGDPSYIDADNSYAIGNNNKISGEKTFVLGNDVETSAKRAVVLGDGSTATEDNIVSVGSKDNPRKIVNVAKGENDTDAVNVAQLKETLSGTVAGVNQALSDLDSRVNKVGAGAAALAALHPGTYNPEDKMSFAVGYGHYKNANAGAFGAFFRPNEDVTVSVGSTFGNGNPMMNAGVSFKLGQRGKRLAPSDAGAVQRLMMENASQAKQIEALAHDNAKLKADNEKMQAQIAMILEKMQLSEMVEKSAR